MAINFPDNPSIGQEHIVGKFTYVWNGKWWYTKTTGVKPKLSFMSDVDVSTATAGDYLVYNSSNQKFEAKSLLDNPECALIKTSNHEIGIQGTGISGTGDPVTIPYNNLIYESDVGSFNTSTYTYTIQNTGIFYISFLYWLKSNRFSFTITFEWDVYLNKNGSNYKLMFRGDMSNRITGQSGIQYRAPTTQFVEEFTAGDTIKIQHVPTASSSDYLRLYSNETNQAVGNFSIINLM
jgi:hypothetical protein